MPHFNESRVAKGMKGAKFTYLFYFLLTKYNERTQFVEKMCELAVQLGMHLLIMIAARFK